MEVTGSHSLLVLSLSIFLKWSISMFPYSGKNVPPMFGDYEAQRHWQEITVNLPVNSWYKNTSQNDLLYWGLDYPPLTAYHSWIVGKIAEKIDPSWVELTVSRGTESEVHKLFMRYSVLFSDLVTFFPAVFLYSSWFMKRGKISESGWKLLIGLLFYPGLSLIDYGHFQYNGVSLGFFIMAVACLDRGMMLLGSAAFCLALNYKQMELYHSFPFFMYILGNCLKKQESLFKRISRVAAVGIVVLGTFAICWFPFLRSFDDALAVVQRLFPFSRGVFEDKVSNFWCTVNVVFKIKNLIPQPKLVSVCAAATLLSIVPSSINLLLNPVMKKFKYSLVVCSLGFFLFSYQVHEKTILVPAVSALLIGVDEPFMLIWFSLTSVFSMLPLLAKDGLMIASVVTGLLFTILMLLMHENAMNNFLKKLMFTASCVGMVILTFCLAWVQAPPRYPDLWPTLISIYSSGHFMFYYLYFNYMQWKI